MSKGLRITKQYSPANTLLYRPYVKTFW